MPPVDALLADADALLADADALLADALLDGAGPADGTVPAVRTVTVDGDHRVVAVLRTVPGRQPQVTGLGFLDLPAGRVTAVGDLTRVRALPFVASIHLAVAVGDRIAPPGDGGPRHGHLLVTGVNRAQVERRLRQVRELVRAAVRVVAVPNA